MEKKMNKVAKFEAVVTMISGEDSALTSQEAIEFLNHEIELIQKGAERKSAKTAANATTNAKTAEKVLAVLADNGKMRVSEIIKDSRVAELSSSKVTYLLGILCESGKAVKSTEKRISYYSIAE